jgi:hypothetical protein
MNILNNCTADVYINWCYEVLFNVKDNFVVMNSFKVASYICSTHFLKLIIQKTRMIKKFESQLENIKLRKSFIFAFTILQNE